MKKVIKIGAGLILLLALIGFVALNKTAPYAIIEPYRINENYTPTDLGLESEKLIFYGIDSVELSAYWVKSQRDTVKGIVILVHGIGSCKEHRLNSAKLLSEQGVESIVFDGRGHGESGGDYTTYGFYEKKDVSKIVDAIQARQPNLKIGIWGHSLGGAIAIQALEYDDRIKFGVIESTFTELDKIVYDYTKRMMKGIGIRFVSDYALKRAGKIAKFNPDEVKPIKSVEHIHQPTFIAHGNADKNISVEYGKQLYNNLQAKNKELVIIEGGGHNDLFEIGGEEYTSKILSFIEKNW